MLHPTAGVVRLVVSVLIARVVYCSFAWRWQQENVQQAWQQDARVCQPGAVRVCVEAAAKVWVERVRVIDGTWQEVRLTFVRCVCRGDGLGKHGTGMKSHIRVERREDQAGVRRVWKCAPRGL